MIAIAQAVPNGVILIISISLPNWYAPSQWPIRNCESTNHTAV